MNCKQLGDFFSLFLRDILIQKQSYSDPSDHLLEQLVHHNTFPERETDSSVCLKQNGSLLCIDLPNVLANYPAAKR